MGGFSASYVVHSDRAADVEGTLRQLLFDDGWRPSDQPLNDEESMGLGGPRRGIIVCKPTGEWTPVIDSAALVSEMPSQLSETMNTSVLNVHVHDSDFWMYSLFRRGEMIDQYSSMNVDDYFGGALGDAFGDEAAMMGGSGSIERTLDERWDILFDYLAEGVTKASFDQVMKPADPTLGMDGYVMGEEGLERFFQLIGVEPSLAYLSYRYWLEDPHDQPLQEHCHLLLKEG